MELGILSLSDLQTDPATGTQIRLLRLAIPDFVRRGFTAEAPDLVCAGT